MPALRDNVPRPCIPAYYIYGIWHALPEDGRGPVQEVGGEVEHDGELGELLQELPRGQRRVVRGSTPDQQEPAAALWED